MLSTISVDENGETRVSESPNEYVKVKTPSGQREVNRWHTLGPGENSIVLPLCQLAREKLPRLVLPIHVGNTGYINLNERISEFPNGWCLDDLNRTVFIFNNYLYFQRYESGGCIMYNSLSEGCFNQILVNEKVLSDQLSGL